MTAESGHILIVDDHRTTRLKLSIGLMQQGHEVTEAENGLQALDLLRKNEFDLVLLDILMPEMDGYEVLKQMRHDRFLRDIPVIVISAHDELESVVKGIELGADDYLPKSYDPILLKARIGSCLEKKRLRDQQARYLVRIEKEKGRSEKLINIVIPIGVALPTEKDFNQLLERILLEAKSLCHADGGILYLRNEQQELEFVILRVDSINLTLGGSTGKPVQIPSLPLFNAETGEPDQTHVSTVAAIRGLSVHIPDVYHADGFAFSGLRENDRQIQYHTQSCLTIPLKNRENDVIGVLQLLNAKDAETGEIIPFDEYLRQLLESLSSLAAAALEIYCREQKLREQIDELRIEIDEVKQSRQVAEITESEYFHYLEKEAESLRQVLESTKNGITRSPRPC